MKIEVGKFYRTRGGGKVGPLWLDATRSSWSRYKWMGAGDIEGRYSDTGQDGDGKGYMPPTDLIAEWTDAAPEFGTLQEIGAQVGDVVECVGNTGAHGSLQLGREYEVAQSGLVIDEQGDEYDWITPKFRIISRANQSPVREVTTVRKEIVPGVYGRVAVKRWVSNPEKFVFGFTSSNGSTCGATMEVLSQGELTAAIDTLTAIRDAMAYSTGDTTTAQAR